MTMIASSSTWSTVRGAKRRGRQVRHRSRRLKPKMRSLEAPNRRGSKRRKLRDHESLNLESCYYACEDRGYHLDPDLRVGPEISHDADRYWLPQCEMTDPTVVIEETSPLLEFSTVGTSESSALLTLPEAGKGKVAFKSKDTQGPLQMDILTGSASPPLPSILTAADATPKVEIPGSHLESLMNGRPPEYHSDYLNDIRIPSPLLYHNSPLEHVPPSRDPRSSSNILRFEFACGQQIPEPDFTSYRPTARSGIQDKRACLQRCESLGFALCTAASSRHKPEASHVSDESHDSSTHGDEYSSLVNCPDSRESAWNTQYSLSTADINNHQSFTPTGLEYSWYNEDVKRKTSHRKEDNVHHDVGSIADNLIFHALPTPLCLEDTLVAHRNINKTVLPEENQAAADCEQAGEVFPSSASLVDKTLLPCGSNALVAAIHAVRRRREAQGIQMSPNCKDDGSISDDAQPGAAAKVVLSPCMDFVPARLYRRQFISWPLPTSPIDSDSLGVLKMVDWLQELNTLKPYAYGGLGLSIQTLRPNESNSNSGNGILTSEANSSPISSVQVQCQGPLSVDEADSEPHNEDYFTNCERYSEVDLLDDTISEEEWANWDWDFGTPDVDERIGLFATEWEAASEEGKEGRL